MAPSTLLRHLMDIPGVVNFILLFQQIQTLLQVVPIIIPSNFMIFLPALRSPQEHMYCATVQGGHQTIQVPAKEVRLFPLPPKPSLLMAPVPGITVLLLTQPNSIFARHLMDNPGMENS